MKRAMLTCLIVSLAAFTGCKDKEPPRASNIVDAQQDQTTIGQEVDQEDPNTCFGEPTDEEPDFDLALEVTQEGEKMRFHLTVAEKKGLRVCAIRLHVRHNTLNEETGEWEWDGQYAPVMIERVNPGQVVDKVTPVYTGEFPRVTEAGPPEAWTVLVDNYHDVREP